MNEGSPQPEAPGLELKLQLDIRQQWDIRVLESGWDKQSLQILDATLRFLERKLDAIALGNGNRWIKANLGGARISAGADHTLLGNGYILKKLFHGRSHVVGSRVFLAEDFLHRAWRLPRRRVDLWIIHEFAHVWDNRSAHGWGSITGGGYGDALMKFAGGRSKAFLGLRFTDRSLVIDRLLAFSADGNLRYGNNSPADYFANLFVAAIAFPDTPGVPAAAVAWMINLIRKTTPLAPGGV